MKLVQCKHRQDYVFTLLFENGETRQADLRALIEKYVSPNELDTACVNPEWGCLEFNQGRVDVEPKTLYRHASKAMPCG